MPTRTKTRPQPDLQRLLRESHRRQFAGEDYQGVAIDIATEHGISYESDDFKELMTSPSPGCPCGFCGTAHWQD